MAQVWFSGSKLVRLVTMCRSVEENNILRIPAMTSKQSKSVTSENDEICDLFGLTQGQDTTMDADP